MWQIQVFQSQNAASPVTYSVTRITYTKNDSEMLQNLCYDFLLRSHKEILTNIYCSAIYLDKISYSTWRLCFVLFQLWNKLKSISHFSFTLFTNTLWYISKIVTHSDKNRVRNVWTKSQKHLNYLPLHHFSSIFKSLSTLMNRALVWPFPR